jgi:hypothetical protein
MTAEIRKFTGKRVRDIVVDDGFNTPAPQAPVQQPIVDQAQPDVKATAAVDVVQTLAFYANGGMDGGAAALKTMRGMQGIVAANEGRLA